MKSSRSRLGAIGLSLAMAIILASCASAPAKQQEPWPEAKRNDWENKEVKDDPCKAKGGEPKTCSSDEDCCKGFVCSRDPERSRIDHYCLEG